MRKLNKEETELTERNVKKHMEEIRKLTENLEYNKALINKQDYMRAFDNKWRKYLQDQKDEEDKKVMDMIKAEIENRQNTISISKKQLKEGVEEKRPVGVE